MDNKKCSTVNSFNSARKCGSHPKGKEVLGLILPPPFPPIPDIPFPDDEPDDEPEDMIE